MWASNVIIKKLPIVINHPVGENSFNLVTLMVLLLLSFFTRGNLYIQA
jgi:hypothetical protein